MSIKLIKKLCQALTIPSAYYVMSGGRVWEEAKVSLDRDNK